MKTAGRIFCVFYRVLSCAVITAAVSLLVLFLFGIRPYAVRTGSMEPAVPKGSLCFVNHRAAFEEVREGDVIAFKSGEMFVTHRAVSVHNGGITTKGDANNNVDAARVTGESYIGKTVFWLPFLGELPLFAQSGSGRFVFAGIFLAFVLGGILYDRISKRRYQEKNAAKSGGAD